MTGTEPESDEIIEIGAIKFTLDGRTESFQTLVNPGRPLPYRIQTLTGIRDEELQSAPPFAMVADRLREFIGGDPIVGQHVGFDLLYLQKQGIRPTGPVFNTAEIAELVMPGLASYSLRALTKRLGVDFPIQHRALYDAEAAKEVFLRLRHHAAVAGGPLLAEVVQLTAQSSWPLRYFFRNLVDSPESIDAGTVARRLPVADPPPIQEAQGGRGKRATHATPSDEMAAVFGAIERRPDAFPGFEQRPQQVTMAAAVADALEGSANLLVEAGTGTGKSLAYLLPAACFALRHGERVVISTSTINLQQQILEKDVPALKRLLAECGPEDVRDKLDDLRAVPLKGRANYLCLQKFAGFRRQAAFTNEEARFAAKLLFWLAQSQSGDRAELNLRPEEEALWARLSAGNENCFAGPSYFVRNGTCQLLRARKQAEAAHLVIVNHALLLSDIANGGRALPQYSRLIVDEAHNLEDEATNQFGFHLGSTELRTTLAAIHDRSGEQGSGLIVDVRGALHGETADQAPQRSFIAGLADTVAQYTEKARERVPELFDRLQAFVAGHGDTGSEYDNRLLLTAGKRAQPDWQGVELAWENLRVALDLVCDGLTRLGTGLGELGEGASLLDFESLAARSLADAQNLIQMSHGVDDVLGQHHQERIAWLTVHRQFGTVSLASAPLNVGEVLDNYLFSRKSTLVLTSATLSAAGSFQFVRERLGMEDAEELALGSPFDYKRAALVLVPSDIPEPQRLDYQPAVETAIVDLVRASDGRALVLFTSHAALRATYRAIKPRLESDGIRVLGQGLDGSAADLLEALRSEHRTVLLGTASFWEGVDLVGEALSLLIITKLPFSVPTEPIFAARSELYEDPFKEYALPQSILRFKQGFGRLIRHRDDRGALVVLDRRIRSKNYGRAFLDSLPECTFIEAPLGQLPGAVRDWLATGRK